MRNLLALSLLLAAAADGAPSARLDLPPAAARAPLSEIIISGENTTAMPQIVVLRADDMPGPDYAHRVDAERMAPPGHFTLRLRLAALRTPRGRALDLEHLTRISAFSDAAGVQLAAIGTEQPPALPAGSHGWFFGPAAEVPLAGLQTVAPGDAGVSGPAVMRVHRPGGDPVLSWGMRLTRFSTSLPPGRWHVTLWTEDPGEWETLPEVLSRRVRINGNDVVLTRQTHEEWVASRYLRGRDQEADPAATPFASLGAQRGGRIAADVTITDGRLVVELAGHPQAATHLALITASPAATPELAEQAVQALRARSFAESWPELAGPPRPPQANGLSLTRAPAQSSAAGGLLVYRLQAATGAATAGLVPATLSWVDPDAARHGLTLADVHLYWGMWRWRRPAPDVPGLIYSADELRGDSASIPMRADLPRPLVLTWRLPANIRPGRYRLRLTLGAGLPRVSQDLIAEVLAVHRPAPMAKVGPFLDFAPHLTADPAAARRQAACDLDALRALGLTAVAPPLAPPNEDRAGFLADLQAAETGFAAAPIAYAPARHMAAALGDAGAAEQIASADAQARAMGLTPPVWSVADEPSAAGTLDAAIELASRIRLANRNARLAGHLNDPADTRILQYLNVATVNPRFGVDPAMITALRERGVTPWLYNMPQARRAAGFYLWRSGAAGLLQWHGRMPTADAFDPTDGREGDVQFLWPAKDICQNPDLGSELLELAEGAEDLRWLAWLDARAAQGDAAAIRLAASLRDTLGDSWQAASAPGAPGPDAMRARIIALARGLIR